MALRRDAAEPRDRARLNRSRFRPVFSIWAWLVVTPYLISALGGTDGARTAREWTLGIAVSMIVDVVILLVYLLIARLERATAARPPLRWTIVATALVVVAFARPALVTALQGLSGVDLISTPFPTRVVLNVIVIGTATGLMYLLLVSVARSRDGRRRLLAVLGRLRSQTELLEATAARVAEDFLLEVRRPVLDALGALVARELPPRELAEELRWTAHAVIRPLSHRASEARLEDALGEIRIDPEPTPNAPPAVRELLQPSRIVAVPAWLSTFVGVILLLPPELNAQGIPVGLALTAGGAVVSLVGGLLIRLVPLPRRTSAEIVLLSVMELIVGAAICAVLLGGLAITPIVVYYLIYGTSGYAVVAIVLSIIMSGVREAAEHEETTAAAVAEAERRGFAAWRRLATESARTGRMLHTEIQGDVIATSLRLRLGTAGDDALVELIDRVDAVLSDPLAGDADTPSSAAAIRDGFLSSLHAWSLSLAIDADVEPTALDRLAAHPGAAAVAHDALTEGLTNAVRHGQGDRARVRIRLAVDGGAVEVLVANPGRLAARAGRGMGLQDLDARAQSVSLAQEAGEVVLRVTV